MSEAVWRTLFVLFLVFVALVVAETEDDGQYDDAIKFEPLESKSEYEAPTPRGTVFFENFNKDPFVSRWIVSEDPKYNGVWRWNPPQSAIKAIEGDKGLGMTQGAKHYGISSKISPYINKKGKDLIIQYEVKYEETINCGGSYIKLLRKHKDETLALEKLNGNTPHVIMFGPDYCGSDTNKVHFILTYFNPKSKKHVQHHLKNSPHIKNDQLTHLYSVTLSSDNKFELYIDQELARKGTLENDFEPPIQPPKQIPDAAEKKPADWVNDEFIPDPNAVKPADWDESQPRLIDDKDDKKPSTWLDDQPASIPDPEAKKPEEWDDEVDGVWQAPLITNPVCIDHGCGEWRPQQVPNPLYKGKWVAQKIKNPQYIGEWKPRLIDNSDYYVVENWDVDPIGAVAIEVWTMQGGIVLDNFLISHSVEEAKKYAQETFAKKHEIEVAQVPKIEEKAAGWLENVKLTIQNILNEYPSAMIIAATALAALFAVPILVYASK
ncbi:calnexin [Acrasis kona]|uniref:Calnexin n=1 Tax=Acrasis kona TaxID=1008807 RepID=A0AAW2Z5S2_9EUKA